MLENSVDSGHIALLEAFWSESTVVYNQKGLSSCSEQIQPSYTATSDIELAYSETSKIRTSI